jgi:hypothetical protein
MSDDRYRAPHGRIVPEPCGSDTSLGVSDDGRPAKGRNGKAIPADVPDADFRADRDSWTCRTDFSPLVGTVHDAAGPAQRGGRFRRFDALTIRYRVPRRQNGLQPCRVAV